MVSKKAVVIGVCGAVFLIVAFLLSRFPETTNEAIVIGEKEFVIERLETDAERIRGLSGRTELPENHLALFVFDEPKEQGIWMKEMLFPIDILWLDAEGRVMHIEKAVSPDTYPEIFYPEKPASFVIEANVNFSESHNIKIGDILPIR